MTATESIPPITGAVTVGLPVEQAFRVFTGDFTAWWPHQYHIGQADVAEVILEPHEGGRWYERGVDGNECDWGRVLVWAPPNRLVFTWQISGGCGAACGTGRAMTGRSSSASRRSAPPIPSPPSWCRRDAMLRRCGAAWRR
jgi:hypothetical protein